MSKLWSRRWFRLAGPFGVIWAAVVVAGFLTPAVAQAAPTGVSCGVTITADTRLGADLVNCPNNGIVIGADDITLDLNGHTVAGDGSLFPSCPEGVSCDVGIDNIAGHTGVTIRSGSVREFDVAVFVLGGGENRLSPGCPRRTTPHWAWPSGTRVTAASITTPRQPTVWSAF